MSPIPADQPFTLLEFSEGFQLLDGALLGWKSQTRRPVKSGGREYKAGYVLGVVKPNSNTVLDYIEITAVRKENLHDIPERDIYREGFNSIDAFQLAWRCFYDSTEHAWENNPLVWVIDFKLLDK